MLYKVIKSNEALVVSGKGTGTDGYRIKRGGATFVVPFLQKSQKMSLEPFVVEINLEGALSKENIRVSVPSTFTLAVDDTIEGLKIAARRIIDLNDKALTEQSNDIITGQLRAVIASLEIEEINSDREKFESLIEQNVSTELAKLGLSLINVNIRDIEDDSGYIEAIGQKAEAEAKQQANIDKANAEKTETIGVATAEKESNIRTKELTKEQIERETQIEREQIEAQKENKIATSEANKEIEIKNTQFKKEEEIAKLNAKIEVANKSKDEELASKRAKEVVNEEIEKEKAIIKAETEAQKIIKEAEAQAQSIKMSAEAESEKIEKVANAKAEGYKKLVNAVGKDNISSVLMIEKIEEISKINAEALKSIKIDKITVWDNGKDNANGKSGLAGFVDNFAGSIPVMHDIAENAGVKLPNYLGEAVEEEKETGSVKKNIVNNVAQKVNEAVVNED